MLWPYARDTGSRGEPVHIDRWLPPGARKLERHVIDVPADMRTALAVIANLRLRDIPVVRGLFSRLAPPKYDRAEGGAPWPVMELSCGIIS